MKCLPIRWFERVPDEPPLKPDEAPPEELPPPKLGAPLEDDPPLLRAEPDEADGTCGIPLPPFANAGASCVGGAAGGRPGVGATGASISV